MTGPATSGAAWDQAGAGRSWGTARPHARGADPGRVGEEVQAVPPVARRDRQHGTGKPTIPGLRAETPLARQDGRPDGTFSHVVGGLDPGDIHVGPEGRPQGVDACAHPSHPGTRSCASPIDPPP